MVIQRPIVTPHAPTPPRTRGVVNGQSRGRISHARCARDDADADAMGRCDGTARRGDETRATRASVVACERDLTRPDRSSGRVPTVFVHHHHHRRGTGGRASHTDVAHRRHQGDARARIASHPSHPSIHRFDACVTSTRREVRARARTCECVKKVARAARIARGASARGDVGTGVDSSMSRCRRCVDVVAGFIRVTRATSCVRARARWAGATMNRCMTRRSRVDVAWTSRMRVAHGTARHGTARGCARPQTPTSAVV